MATYEKPDFWALKAQREGYPARSVYKLEELDRKFALVTPKSRILDLGAAPGSWSLWLCKKLAKEGSVVAADLCPLSKSLSGKTALRFVQGDITLPEIQKVLCSLGPYNLVLSDMAPATTGIRIVDQAASEMLCETALALAYNVLTRGGAVAIKIFQSGAEKRLATELEGLFSSVALFKPKTSRSISTEVYLVGKGFLGLAKDTPQVQT